MRAVGSVIVQEVRKASKYSLAFPSFGHMLELDWFIGGLSARTFKTMQLTMIWPGRRKLSFCMSSAFSGAPAQCQCNIQVTAAGDFRHAGELVQNRYVSVFHFGSRPSLFARISSVLDPSSRMNCTLGLEWLQNLACVHEKDQSTTRWIFEFDLRLMTPRS